MSQSLSRRQFLRAAGGITFLALVPAGCGVFAAEDVATGLPLFTALPYIQAGNASRLVANAESVIIAWQTEDKDADFDLVFNYGNQKGRKATIQKKIRLSGKETRRNYAATLDKLPLGTKISYKVTGNGKTVVEGYFTTRQPRGGKIRFVALGDNACEAVGNRNVAYQAYLKNPDFVLNTGDSVYTHGLDSEYTRYFFTVFNNDKAAAGVGAPLLRSVPYYSVLGNHDFLFQDPETHHAVADFDVDPGVLGYYTNMYLPENGLEAPPQASPYRGDAQRVQAFRECSGSRYPRMANYSFDYGPVHFLCLDSNLYVDPTNAELQKWIEADLKNTDAHWKVVNYHHPAFNVGKGHYREQHMRALAPLFEAQGVDLVLSGHEHIYQRNRPLRFALENLEKASKVPSGDRRIPGKFTVDREFDGITKTRPDGVIYVTTGAGGQNLYDPDMNENPASWVHPDDNNVEYVARLISDRHSFTVIEVDGKEMTMTQVDEFGKDIEAVRVSKA